MTLLRELSWAAAELHASGHRDGRNAVVSDLVPTMLGMELDESMQPRSGREAGEVKEYVDAVMAQLWPVLLAKAREWEDLGVDAPPPEQVAQVLVERIVALRQQAVDERSAPR